MENPRDKGLSELNRNGVLSTVDDELSQRNIEMMNKLAVYLFFTLQRHLLRKNDSRSVPEFAREIHVKVRDNNPYSLEKRQQRLVSELLAVKVDSSLQDPMDRMETHLNKEAEKICSPSKTENQHQSQPLQTEKEMENLKFIQAITRLSAIINHGVTVPLATIQSLLTPIVTLSKPLSIFGKTSPSPTDSGYSSSISKTQSISIHSGNVQTKELHNIMRVFHSNEIINESVDVVLKHLENLISMDDLSMYENWLDSYLGLAVDYLNQLVDCLCQLDENEVRKKCSAFIEWVILNILTFEGMNNRLQEFKYYFVMKLIDNIYLCEDTINFLFDQLSKFEIHAKNPKYNYLIPIHIVENSYYILKMLEALLTYYLYEMKAKNAEGNATVSCNTWIRGSSKYFSDDEDEDDDDEKEDLNRWIQMLKQCVASFTNTFPLHARFTSAILKICTEPLTL